MAISGTGTLRNSRSVPLVDTGRSNALPVPAYMAVAFKL